MWCSRAASSLSPWGWIWFTILPLHQQQYCVAWKGKKGRHRVFSLTPSMFQWRLLAGTQLRVNNACLACVRPWCESQNHVYAMLTEPRRQRWVPQRWNYRWLWSAICRCWKLTLMSSVRAASALSHWDVSGPSNSSPLISDSRTADKKQLNLLTKCVFWQVYYLCTSDWNHWLWLGM